MCWCHCLTAVLLATSPFDAAWNVSEEPLILPVVYVDVDVDVDVDADEEPESEDDLIVAPACASDVSPFGHESLAGMCSQPTACDDWQVLPPGLMYKSYIAGEKESRMQWVSLHDRRRGQVWEATLGGRVGILRYGTPGAIHPQGWQFDLEGSAQARVDPQQKSDLEAADFRAGFLSTWREGPTAWKFGYYHLSSHVGDEFLIRNPTFVRLNYVRDSLIAGWMRDLRPDTQIYGEIGYALSHEDGALPLEFQFGVQYSPVHETTRRGAPFTALNIHTREDNNFSTSVNVMGGWQWRGPETDHTLRVGAQFYDGPSLQYSFVGVHESMFGAGIWFDY